MTLGVQAIDNYKSKLNNYKKDNCRVKIMSHPDRNNSGNWLNTQSDWKPEDYNALPTTASESYKWALKDREPRLTQVIPIISPARENLEKSRWFRRISNISGSLLSVPQRRRKGEVAQSLEGNETSQFPAITSSFTQPSQPRDDSDIDKAKRGLILILILLSVIGVFIFAFIAQK